MDRKKIAVIEIRDRLKNKSELLVFVDENNFMEYALRIKFSHIPLSLSNLQIGRNGSDVDLPIKFSKNFVKEITNAVNSGVEEVYKVTEYDKEATFTIMRVHDGYNYTDQPTIGYLMADGIFADKYEQAIHFNETMAKLIVNTLNANDNTGSWSFTYDADM